jgi:phage head maturation protease
MTDLNLARPQSSAGRPERKTFAFEYKFVEDGAAQGTFEGYGSVFGNEDDGGDLILPGAFASAIQRHQAESTMPKMLLNHGSMGAASSAETIPWPTCRSAAGTR